jgi:hypothetical protein
VNESYQLALGALAVVGTVISAVVSGYILLGIKSTRARAIADIAQIGINLATETDARRVELASAVKQLQDAINKQGDIFRDKAERLGRDIVEIERRMAYDRGVAGKPFREGD